MRQPLQQNDIRLLKSPEQETYDVGYGKPPVSTQFKPGTSGNPKGRRKGAKNKLPGLGEERLKTLVVEEAYRTIKVREGEINVTVSMAQAVIRAMAVAAARGNTRAAGIFTKLLQITETENKTLHWSMYGSALDFKIAWQKEFDRCDKLGIPRPNPLPHPDDVVANSRTGEVKIKGPLSKEEKELWDAAGKIKAECDENIASLERKLRRQRDLDKRQSLLDSLAEERRLRAAVCKFVPDREPFDRLW